MDYAKRLDEISLRIEQIATRAAEREDALKDLERRLRPAYDPAIFRRKMRQTYFVLAVFAAFIAHVAYKVLT